MPKSRSAWSNINSSARSFLNLSRCVSAILQILNSQILLHTPPNGEQLFGCGALAQSLFQRNNQLVALGHYFVFHIKDVLPLLANLFLQFANLLLDYVLLFESCCQTRLPTRRFDLCFRVEKFFLRRKHHILGPAFQPFPLLHEVMAIR